MNSDLEVEEGTSYKDLLKIYNKYFSLGNLNSNFKNKMALISLVCHLTYQLKSKKPDITHYKVLSKIAEGTGVPDSVIKAICVICDDFSYGCTEFITFDLKGPEMIKTVKNILKEYTPF